MINEDEDFAFVRSRRVICCFFFLMLIVFCFDVFVLCFLYCFVWFIYGVFLIVCVGVLFVEDKYFKVLFSSGYY